MPLDSMNIWGKSYVER